MTKPTGLDQSWGFADPKTAAKAGVQVISMYLSHDPSKNVTAQDVKAYHKAGIALLLNWENNAGAPLAGAGQARADATEAVRQAKALFAAVAYKPQNRVTIYFSCDRDVQAGQFPTVLAYYRQAKTICAAGGFGVGAYGEADLINALAQAGITDSEWQTYAWSGGAISPDTDFYQYSNGRTFAGSSVDFDRVIHPTQLGAWWPPNHHLNTATGADDMPLTDADVQKIANAVWAKTFKSPVNGKQYRASSYLVYANTFAHQARDAVAKIPSVAVDAAAVGMQITNDVKNRLVHLFGGQP